MRIWHKDLIEYLPKSQLLAQWRELNSIYKKQDNHILINYIYDYPKIYLYNYSQIVINEMIRRGYKINKWDNYNKYFNDINIDDFNNISKFVYREHDKEYFIICYWNLYEKYLRGQKDFNFDKWDKIRKEFKFHQIK